MESVRVRFLHELRQNEERCERISFLVRFNELINIIQNTIFSVVICLFQFTWVNFGTHETDKFYIKQHCGTLYYKTKLKCKTKK